GPGDLRPQSPERLAIRINDHILPDTYGTLKPYRVTDDQVIELIETEFDDGHGDSAEATPSEGDE
ncbi:MAG: hypothetical protein ABEI57_06550, partial [Halapricum sp.]